MLKDSLSEFIQELESHCSSTAIATFLDSEGEVFVVDLNRKDLEVSYGYHPYVKQQFLGKLIQGVKTHASLILRSFTSEVDELTNLPIKELRGYLLQREGTKIKFEKLSPGMMFACHNTDAVTGEPRPLEQSVRYC
jgi:hypothetical protein